MIEPEGVEFGFSDVSDLNSLKGGGYAFIFADATESQELKCGIRRSGMSCDDRNGL